MAGAEDNFAVMARINWTCLTEALETGAAGAGGVVGAEPFTQHELSQAQRVQHDGALACASALTGSTPGVTTSSKLNKMANTAFND